MSVLLGQEVNVASPGVWAGPADSYAYQWQGSPDGAAWGPIAGATASSYSVDLPTGWFVRCAVTATNLLGSVTAFSNTLGPVVAAAVQIGRTTLGCGTYQVLILTRGGKTLLGELAWTQLSWGRKLDDTSDADVDLLLSPQCCGVLAQALPWQHELSIVRNGEAIWQGPILSMDLNGETPKVAARDLSAWLDKRLVHNDYALAQIDLATIYQTIWEDAVQPENSAGMNLQVSAVGILGNLTVKAAEYRQAGPLLRDLANAGIDWTVIGRVFIAGGFAVPTATLGPFVLDHFKQLPRVVLDGSKQAGRFVVTGQGGGAAGFAVFGDRASVLAEEQFGLLEEIKNVSSYEDLSTAQEAAASRLAITASPIVTVENAILDARAPFTVDQLIPGAVCSLDIQSCFPVVGPNFRLYTVGGHASKDGEDITLAFQPLGVNLV